jgi:hypothetical protein
MAERYESNPAFPRDIATALDLITEMYERERISFVELRALTEPLHAALGGVSQLPREASDSAHLEPTASSHQQGQA